VNILICIKKKKFKFLTIFIIITLFINSFLMYNIFQNQSIHSKINQLLNINSNSFNQNLIWENFWGGLGYDKAYDTYASLNYVYFTGETRSFGNGENDAFLVKYDLNGTQIWNITWGGSDWDMSKAITVNDSYIYITGYTKSYGENRGICA